ncbi:hypothetical protein ACPOL_4380 [Acidisarcina polymorpha]|uniref:Uncharacterized protein n=1 Tax=Acidisarcina polymorpha TaxID=2211140 RepID=A0A2Z5G361_9BACT|nr:hypothetical protein ACPOL_4380 [Acidisarcina polymorpha]
MEEEELNQPSLVFTAHVEALAVCAPTRERRDQTPAIWA